MGDAAAIGALHAACFPDGWSAATVRTTLRQPSVFALVEGEPPLGFALWRKAADEGEILAIGVAPEARRRGLGRTLMARMALQAQALGVKSLFLEVAIDNSAALALYRGLGYSEVGRRQAYYARAGARIDAQVLRLALA
ncbi:MAG: GNAT family N-acetyltransferase [Alphaproteobacteria bacterium]|nr:GNAT family N-acetyltransferase [Alphaproteobacteria bacterium]